MPEHWLFFECLLCIVRSKVCPLGAQSHDRTDLKPSKEICLYTAKTNKSNNNIFWNIITNVYIRMQKKHGGPDLVRPLWVHLALPFVFSNFQMFGAMVQNGADVDIIP